MARVLIAEPSLPISAALRKFFAGSLHQIAIVHFLDEAVHFVRERDPDMIITSVSGTFDGEVLAAKVKKLKPACAVLLVYPPTEEKPGERAAQAQAEAFLVSPLKKNAVLNAVTLMARVQELALKAEKLEGLLAKQVTMPEVGTANTVDLGFFRKLLGHEVKRSERYKVPLSFLLVGLDSFEERMSRATDVQRGFIRTQCMAAAARCVRDIDWVVPLTDDRFLVFLPHTPPDGALAVSGRIHAKLAALPAWEGGTASIGISVFNPNLERDTKVSFGQLMKEAVVALKRAQAQGGSRIEAEIEKSDHRRSRISMG